LEAVLKGLGVVVVGEVIVVIIMEVIAEVIVAVIIGEVEDMGMDRDDSFGETGFSVAVKMVAPT
jgi:hypothetical protein